MGATSYCSWCHEPLPPLGENASFVDELNHTMHDSCRQEQDAFFENRDALMTSIAAGTAAPVPSALSDAYLAGVRGAGLVRRCPCLYDPAHGFRGYDAHVWSGDDERDYDARNAVPGCPLCGGSGRHDRLPELLAIHDDAAAARWVKKELPGGAGPLREHDGWYYTTLGVGPSIDGVVLYNVGLMRGGVVSWSEVAEVFRPRIQQLLF